ncbi:MAG: hypothetical protein PUD41_11175 [bacterium]|nr:hypothetical protein [bacterium]
MIRSDPALSQNVLLGRRNVAIRSTRFTSSILMKGLPAFITP